jgi:hypothetical protein
MPILLKRFHHRGAVPRWAHDRAKLWNGAEMRERNGKRGKNAGAFKTDVRTAHDLLFTFPAELSKAGRSLTSSERARILHLLCEGTDGFKVGSRR